MKRRINKKRLLILIIGLFVILGLIAFLIFQFMITKIEFNSKKTILVNETACVKDYVKKIKNGKITNLNEKITFDELGDQKITITYKTRFGFKKVKELTIEVIDNVAPTLNAPKKITIIEGDEDDLLQYVEFSDNYDTDINVKIEGDYSKDKAGEYELFFVATDKSGNETKIPFVLEVNEKKIVVNQNASAYYVKVNKTLNVAMVYGKDSNGEYTKLVKTFLVSTGGNNTPNGIWTTTDRYETLSLVEGVWGHYTLRITGPIFFHSVPYFSRPSQDNPYWNDLEYEEFNKLGTTASKGCVRLSTIDAKWIYDNLPWHTQVEVYESNELPEGVIKPEGIKIDINSEKRGWDPTDPDPSNPWNL